MEEGAMVRKRNTREMNHIMGFVYLLGFAICATTLLTGMVTVGQALEGSNGIRRELGPSSPFTDTIRDGGEEILLSVVLMRHGDRSPVRCLPADWSCGERWKEGLGKLTARGLNHSFTVGAALRKRYVDEYKLIPPRYSSRQIRARSTDYDRTQRTAVGVLHGLYPPGTGPRQEDGSPGLTQYHLEAVPVYSTPRKFDSLLRSYSIETCPNWDRFASTERQLHSADYQKLEKETAPIRREIASISGFAEVDLGMINSVRDSFNVMRLYKIPWPEGMTQSRLDHLERLCNELRWLRFSTPELKQVATGRMLEELLSRIKAASRGEVQRGFRAGEYPNPGEDGPNLYLYVTHDTYIAALLYTLGVAARGDPNPPYVSSVVFELVRANNGKEYVRLFYNKGAGTADKTNSGENHPPPFSKENVVKLPACQDKSVDGLCPLDVFVSRIFHHALTQDEWEGKCGASKSSTTYEAENLRIQDEGTNEEDTNVNASVSNDNSTNSSLGVWSWMLILLASATGAFIIRSKVRRYL